MSEPGPDPIDRTYSEAEARLADEDARAARRARVLAAVAAQETAKPAPKARLAWRQGSWLAAASVAGLAVFLASQVYQPAPRSPPEASPAIAKPASAASPPTVQAPSSAPATPTPAAKLAVPPPPPPVVRNAPRDAFPAEAALAPLAKSQTGPPVTAERDQPEGAGKDSLESADARRAEKPAPPPPPPPSPLAAAPTPQFSAASAIDPPATLRAAAAAGHLGELKTLLDQGVPVDSADAAGNTALMESVRAGNPAVARLLRRHGASLDRRNSSGQSARDLAAQKDDAELDKALGLGP